MNMCSEEKETAVAAAKAADNFKLSFKYFKSRRPPPDLGQVLDLHRAGTASDVLVTRAKCAPGDSDRAGGNGDSNARQETPSQQLGLTNPDTWRVARLESVPGLLLISNPFTPRGQARWALRCLRDYAKSPPNKTNLDGQKWGGGGLSDSADTPDWFRASQSDVSLLPRLRWATLGYHHDWDTKVYSSANVSTFPADLADLSRLVAESVGFANYLPQAAIVNFYPMDATLGGHTDHSEPNRAAPLLSFSLGQDAIFLIGGPTRETRPVPVWLRSGDILIMSGQARLCMHAVPRIVQSTSSCQPWKYQNRTGDEDMSFCQSYLANHRININVRQVF